MLNIFPHILLRFYKNVKAVGIVPGLIEEKQSLNHTLA
jgi:hypothetical protein